MAYDARFKNKIIFSQHIAGQDLIPLSVRDNLTIDQNSILFNAIHSQDDSIPHIIMTSSDTQCMSNNLMRF